MKKVNSSDRYDYYIGWEEGTNKPFYNIVPIGNPAPNGGYYAKEWILGIKKCADLFHPNKPKF